MANSSRIGERTVTSDKDEFLAFVESLGLKAEISEVTLSGEKLTRIMLGSGMDLSGKGPHSYSWEETGEGKIAQIKWANDLKYTDSFGNEKKHENIDRIVFDGRKATLHSYHVSPDDGATLAVLVKDEKGRLIKGENGRYKTRKVEDPAEAKLTVSYELSGARLEQK